MKKFFLMLIVILAGVAPLVASPTMYTGGLSVGDGGLVATELWNVPSTELSWVVSNTSQSIWHYEYCFSVLEKGISHINIEVSDEDSGPAFTLANLFGLSSDPEFALEHIELQDWTSSNGNPGIPGEMYGIKFDLNDGYLGVTVGFDSDRAPVWGDFYAKDGSVIGGPVYAYNAGFLLTDPTIALHNGAEQGHLLVPDSVSVIPAPGALLLSGIGLGFASLVRRRIS